VAHSRTVAVTCVVGNLLVGELAAVEAQNPVAVVSDPQRSDERPDLLVRLHVFNTARLPSPLLTDAEREASSVYRTAGVMLVWTDGLADHDSNPVSPNAGVDLRVIVVAGTAERRLIDDGHLGDTILGFAPTRRGCFCGRNAYIFSERIMTIGYQRGNPTSLLGRVVAHEVGHLLLSSDSHSRTGIMRATLDTDLALQPRFTTDEVGALRRGIARLRATQTVISSGPRP
jgi:hypothetical protein